MKSLECCKEIKFESSVTSLKFYGGFRNQNYLISVGLESGAICIVELKSCDGVIEVVSNEVLRDQDSHVESVKSLDWKPVNDEGLYLASCSEDHSVRVFKL
jgi:elongator complex protein 2